MEKQVNRSNRRTFATAITNIKVIEAETRTNNDVYKGYRFGSFITLLVFLVVYMFVFSGPKAHADTISDTASTVISTITKVDELNRKSLGVGWLR
ncbi:MAG: hypothetical protein LBI63_03725 [Candidatus Ancillula sp.]|nr:hypothetical protein [Candidatus Ancillula sp.]